MQRRERNLLMVLCAAVVVALLWFLVTGGGVSSSDLAKEKARLSDEKAKSAKKLDAAMEDVALMKDCRSRDRQAALYGLADQARRAGEVREYEGRTR